MAARSNSAAIAGSWGKPRSDMAIAAVKIEGLKELDEQLINEIPKRVRAVVRPALKEAGAFMQSLIAGAAPRSSQDHPHPQGELSKTVQVQVNISAKYDSGSVKVGYSDDQFYAWFVEFGHRIVRGGWSRIRRGGGASGPGKDTGETVPPHPFVRPTFDANQGQWSEVIEMQLKERLDFNV